MKQQTSANKRLLRNDLLFIAFLLFLASIGFVYLFVFRDSGDTVRVTVDGELYGVYSLSDEISEEIGHGEGQYNRFVVRGGQAYMASATCPDGICVDHRPIHRNGESIVCLPNRVVITVVVDGDENAPDVVA